MQKGNPDFSRTAVEISVNEVQSRELELIFSEFSEPFMGPNNEYSFEHFTNKYILSKIHLDEKFYYIELILSYEN